MRTALVWWIMVGPVAIAAGVPENEGKDGGDQADRVTLQPVLAELRPLIRLGPHRLKPTSGETAEGRETYVVGYLEAQRVLLEMALTEEPPPAEALTLHLSAANWELSAAGATPVSRILWGLDDETDRSALTLAAQSAAKHLAAAGELLEKADLDDEKLENIVSTRMTLNAFAEMFAALADPEMAERKEKLRSVLTSTALLLEDERPEVQAAAEMYQAYALARSGNFKRARTVLKLVLTPPTTETREFSLMGKLLRLRILAAGGQSTASWLLTLRTEERANTWVRDGAVADQFKRALAVLRFEAVAAMRQEAETRNDEQALSWCDEQAKEIRDESLSGRGPLPLYRLTYGVPQLVEPPAKPEWISVFGLATASPSLLFVVDLSSAVPPTQQRDLKRQVAAACRKLAPPNVFGLVLTGEADGEIYGDKPLGPATEQRREGAEGWLLEKKAQAETELSPVLAKAVAAKPRHLILLSDRAGEGRWVQDLIEIARSGNVHVDMIHVRPVADDPVRGNILSVGGRYVHLEREKPEASGQDQPDPKKPETDAPRSVDDEANEEKPAEAEQE